MRAALSERAFVDEPNMLEHLTGVSVVFRDIHPGTVEIELVEDVIQESKCGRSAKSTMPQVFPANED